MTTELTRADPDMLQDALAYKLLCLKDDGPIFGLARADTLPITRMIAKLETLKEDDKDEDSARAK